MRLVFLGTGGSYPSKERNVACTALKMNGDVILFDVGEGTQRQMMHSSISFMQVSHILLSHFHGDHFLGLPGMIQTMYLNEREKPLLIVGPPGTERRISTLLGLGHFHPTFDIEVRDVNDGVVLTQDGFDITARSVDHGVPGLAYSVEEHKRPGRFNKPRALALGIPEGPLFRRLQGGESVEVDGRRISPEEVVGPPRRGRKVVYSGDTRPCQAVVELAKGADVLVHEATGTDEIEKKMNEYGHTTARQAGDIARMAKVKVLFLVHISPRYREADQLEKEAKAVFKDTYIADDLLEFDVPYPPDDEKA